MSEEREILDGARALIGVDSAELVGQYPDTKIRLTLTDKDRSDVREWSIWDGKITGSPPGVGAGPEEYLQMLGLEVIYWLYPPG